MSPPAGRVFNPFEGDPLVSATFSELGVIAAAVALLEPEGDFVRIVAARGYNTTLVEAFRRFSVNEPLVLVDALRTGETIWLDSEGEWEQRYLSSAAVFFHSSDKHSWAAVPFLLGRQARAALWLTFIRERPCSPEERSRVLSLAAHIGTQLESAALVAM